EHGAKGVWERAGFLGSKDHPQRGAVLHRSTRIRRFHLGPELAAQPRTESPQWDQRRVSDPLQDRPADQLADAVGRETHGGCGVIVDRGGRHYLSQSTDWFGLRKEDRVRRS